VIGAASGLSRRARILNLLELNVVIFAFLLNFVWEFWQVPFYRDLPSGPHWQATKVCSLATVGDAAIMLVSFWAVAAAARARAWVLGPSAVQVVLFTMVGIVVTVIAEWVATEELHVWAYANQMPILPLLGMGLLPLLQWMILPPPVVWFVQQQRT
jgi:hypothetical protein